MLFELKIPSWSKIVLEGIVFEQVSDFNYLSFIWYTGLERTKQRKKQAYNC